MYGICCPINRYQRSKICHNLNTSGECWVFKCPACKPRAQNIWGFWWPRYGRIMQHSYCHKVQTGKQPKKIIFITQRALTKKRWQVGCCWNGFAPSPSFFFSYQNVHTHCSWAVQRYVTCSCSWSRCKSYQSWFRKQRNVWKALKSGASSPIGRSPSGIALSPLSLGWGKDEGKKEEWNQGGKPLPSTWCYYSFYQVQLQN